MLLPNTHAGVSEVSIIINSLNIHKRVLLTTPACSHNSYITCRSVGSFRNFTTQIFCVLCGRDGLTLSRH